MRPLKVEVEMAEKLMGLVGELYPCKTKPVERIEVLSTLGRRILPIERDLQKIEQSALPENC